MHELPVTEKILTLALKHAEQNEVNKIHSITLHVGRLTDLKDQWLQHYFNYLSKDTIAQDARLIIIPEAIRLQCGKCRTLIETEKRDLQDITCPHCGADGGFSIKAGRGYFIEEMTAE
ncbi:MAG: hydrogenase maturation nickel metallochaperone HypA [Desulfobacterales bacterium]|nr:hydrogenase maturation nickel metallochaperone HypA [Desulfobacterales bacterium]